MKGGHQLRSVVRYLAGMGAAGLTLLSVSATAIGCSTSEWSAVVDPGSNLLPTHNFHFEADCGLGVTAGGSNPAYVEDQTPSDLASAVKRYIARFYLLLDPLTLGSSSDIVLFAGYTDSRSTPLFEVRLVLISGQNRLRLVAYQDDGSSRSTTGNELVVLDGWRAVAVDWAAAVAPGNNDGYLKILVDGVQGSGAQLLSGLDTDTLKVDYVQLGKVRGTFTGVNGVFAVDAFVSQRIGTPGIVLKSCSGDSVVVDNHTFLPGTTQCTANFQLSTAGYVTVDGGADVSFTAQSVRLLPGFIASKGSQFHALPVP